MDTGLFLQKTKRGNSAGRIRRTLKDAKLRAGRIIFAEALSKHGNVKKAAAAAGYSRRHGYVLLARLRSDLGWQAV